MLYAWGGGGEGGSPLAVALLPGIRHEGMDISEVSVYGCSTTQACTTCSAKPGGVIALSVIWFRLGWQRKWDRRLSFVTHCTVDLLLRDRKA